MSSTKIKRRKIKKGWYQVGDCHVVVTERLGNDKVDDWVVVKTEEEGRRIIHGGEPCEYLEVFNRLRDAVRWIQNKGWN